MSGGGRCRRARNRSTSSATRRSRDEAMPVFDTFTLDELMRLNDIDLDQLDALDDPEGAALWWHLRQLEWAEEAHPKGRRP